VRITLLQPPSDLLGLRPDLLAVLRLGWGTPHLTPDKEYLWGIAHEAFYHKLE
jgi:hypothetical protein